MTKEYYDEDGNIIFLQQCPACFTFLSVSGERKCLNCGWEEENKK
jgi:hypothetical protein